MIWTTPKQELACGLPEDHHISVSPRGKGDVFWSVHIEDMNDDAGDDPDGGDAIILETYGTAATISGARRAAEQAYKRLCRLSRSYGKMAGFALGTSETPA